MAAATEIMLIRDTRGRMARLLCAWSIASVLLAVAIYWAATSQESASRKFGEALASQFMIWGLIDLVFAALGLLQARRATAAPLDDGQIQAELNESRKLQQTLRFNGKLNWIWLSAGVVLLVSGLATAARGGSAEAVGSLLGHAAGVLVQGGFLFWFDRRFLGALEAASVPPSQP